ncbi:MAG: phospholipase D-like domain-containing protein [Dehalococcoidia bacterium]
MELYVGRNPVRRWKAEIERAEEASMILSPYVTSSTAETVLKAWAHERPTLYTLFEPLLFASGASSLRTLKRILEDGCSVYHVPDLHAKIVLVPGTFCSIGSQNLTASGTRRKEASVTIRDPGQLKKVLDSIQPWLEAAQPVTEEMVDDLQLAIEPLQKKYVEVVREAEEPRAKAQAARGLRAAQARAARLARGNKVVKDRTAGSEAKWLTIKHLPSGYSMRWTLAAEPYENLLLWSKAGRRIALEKTHRCLLYVPSTGKIAWARVMKGCITKFGLQIQWGTPIVLGGKRLRIRAESVIDQESEANLKLRLWPFNAPRVAELELHTWFSLDGLELLSASYDNDDGTYESILQDWPVTSRKLTDFLLEPFRYERNLYGVEAKEFMGRGWGSWHLTLGTIDTGRFLVAT